ncbi:Hint domain-containing protein [Tropicimonas sediminicola]|uniref:Hint domain-containing protein n=1 Tax=Tropicimonas sediminicola TaxID=1031541 RepID=UPI00159571AD|nr:Hint domain-containing protein [Tropicimonas sediminicola]
MVETSFGMVPAHLIRKGDPVHVGKGRFKPVRAVRTYSFDEDFLEAQPEARPVEVASAASHLRSAPRKLQLAPGQPVLVAGARSRDAVRVVPAIDIGKYAEATPDSTGPLTYVRLIFDTEEFVPIEGVGLKCAGPDA